MRKEFSMTGLPATQETFRDYDVGAYVGAHNQESTTATAAFRRQLGMSAFSDIQSSTIYTVDGVSLFPAHIDDFNAWQKEASLEDIHQNGYTKSFDVMSYSFHPDFEYLKSIPPYEEVVGERRTYDSKIVDYHGKNIQFKVLDPEHNRFVLLYTTQEWHYENKGLPSSVSTGTWKEEIIEYSNGVATVLSTNQTSGTSAGDFRLDSIQFVDASNKYRHFRSAVFDPGGESIESDDWYYANVLPHTLGEESATMECPGESDTVVKDYTAVDSFTNPFHPSSTPFTLNALFSANSLSMAFIHEHFVYTNSAFHFLNIGIGFYALPEEDWHEAYASTIAFRMSLKYDNTEIGSIAPGNLGTYHTRMWPLATNYAKSVKGALFDSYTVSYNTHLDDYIYMTSDMTSMGDFDVLPGQNLLSVTVPDVPHIVRYNGNSVVNPINSLDSPTEDNYGIPAVNKVTTIVTSYDGSYDLEEE